MGNASRELYKINEKKPLYNYREPDELPPFDPPYKLRVNGDLIQANDREELAALLAQSSANRAAAAASQRLRRS